MLFVPPLAIASVPAKVTAPVVAAVGVSPVVPVEKDRTPPLAMEIVPGPLVTEMPAPAVNVLS